MIKQLYEPVKDVLSLREAAYKALKRLGILNLRDLLFYRPLAFKRYNVNPDFSRLQADELIQADITIIDFDSPSGRPPVRIKAGNSTGEVTLVYFSKLPVFLYKQLKRGAKYRIAGKVEYYRGSYQIVHPDFIFNQQNFSAVIPTYPLTYGLLNKQLYNYICEAIKYLQHHLDQSKNLPETKQQYLADLLSDIKNLHAFDNTGRSDRELNLAYNSAVKNLAARELLANQMMLARLKRLKQQHNGQRFYKASTLQEQVMHKVGYQLTAGQQTAMAELQQDQASTKQMMRLLQGDVGSGKTIVALLTMLNVTNSGVQAVLMAPTDILARQHYAFFSKTLEGIGNTKVELLTGKIKAAKRRQLLAELKDGSINMLIGTHALFQDDVAFANLGYVIIDEQHRFGTEQRLSLINKASRPDVLVMTATPIPRSLSLTMFGDMDISVIKDKPANRQPITTSLISRDRELEVARALQKKLDLNQKIYWVCPLIDPSDKSLELSEEQTKLAEFADYQPQDATTRYESLAEIYPRQVGLLHGKMKEPEKEATMAKYASGELNIIVATTVIEVGINVPESTLIIIENAEKFGLAQLHQLRGRVGRSDLASHCILLYEKVALSKNTKQRLEIMRQTNDGFLIASKDLELRGSGEMLGKRQSGEPVFFFADLQDDLPLLEQQHNKAESESIAADADERIELFARVELGVL